MNLTSQNNQHLLISISWSWKGNAMVVGEGISFKFKSLKNNRVIITKRMWLNFFGKKRKKNGGKYEETQK